MDSTEFMDFEEQLSEMINRDKMIRAQLDLRSQQLEKLWTRFVNHEFSGDDIRLMQEISREQLQQVEAFL